MFTCTYLTSTTLALFSGFNSRCQKHHLEYQKKKENICTHVLETFPMIPVPPLKAAGLISSSGGKDVKESMMKV